MTVGTQLQKLSWRQKDIFVPIQTKVVRNDFEAAVCLMKQFGCAKILCSRVELEVTTYEGVFSMFFVCLFGQGNIEF